VIARGTWATERNFFDAIRFCSSVFGDAKCRVVVIGLDQQVQVDIEILAWVAIGVTVALALITAALVSSNKKPATVLRPPA
jgi:hypothetical protein